MLLYTPEATLSSLEIWDLWKSKLVWLYYYYATYRVILYYTLAYGKNKRPGWTSSLPLKDLPFLLWFVRNAGTFSYLGQKSWRVKRLLVLAFSFLLRHKEFPPAFRQHIPLNCWLSESKQRPFCLLQSRAFTLFSRSEVCRYNAPLGKNGFPPALQYRDRNPEG